MEPLIAACTNTMTHAHYAHTHVHSVLIDCKNTVGLRTENNSNRRHRAVNSVKCIQISFECKADTNARTYIDVDVM